jgi:hypothetical protein
LAKKVPKPFSSKAFSNFQQALYKPIKNYQMTKNYENRANKSKSVLGPLLPATIKQITQNPQNIAQIDEFGLVLGF